MNRLQNLYVRLPYSVKRLLKRIGVYKLAVRCIGNSYEPEVQTIIHSLVQPGWVCVDVGANVGSFTRILAGIVGPTGHIYAFEPHPDNVRDLREDMSDLGYKARVTVEQTAVSDGSQDRLSLFPGPGRMSVVWNTVGNNVDGVAVAAEMEVRAVSLDDYFARRARAASSAVKVNLVKIDVEGAGAGVLAGMQGLLREARPVVLMEFHDAEEWAGREELMAANYTLYDETGKVIPEGSDFSGRVHSLAMPKEMAPFRLTTAGSAKGAH